MYETSVMKLKGGGVWKKVKLFKNVILKMMLSK